MRSNPRDDSGLVAAAKRLRVELLTTKGELERELGRCSCNAGGATVACIGFRGWGQSRDTGHTRSRRRRDTDQTSCSFRLRA
jgi:hypothetical protein